MWAQTRDRAAAMLAHAVISIGKLDAIPTDRRCDRTWSWHHHRRRRPVLGSSEARQNDALWTRVLLAVVDLLVGRTQWVVLSAPDVHPWCGASHAAPGSARPAPTARFNLWPRFCPNYSHNEPMHNLCHHPSSVPATSRARPNRPVPRAPRALRGML